MKGEDKIIELLAEMVHRQDQIIARMDRHEEQFKKTNIELADLRLSVMQLADQLKVVADHERRLDALERTVFKN